MCARTRITTYHLEMLSPGELRPASDDDSRLAVTRAEVPCPELNRFFYTAVGGQWYWIDRLDWTYDQWLSYVTRPGFETWFGSWAGTPCGYFTLEAQDGGSSVEILNFGLLPQFIGKGIGGRLLTAAARRAWATGASRVWVHTCTLDHPSALGNYRARGFRLFKEEVTEKDLPNRTPGPWPGAHPESSTPSAD